MGSDTLFKKKLKDKKLKIMEYVIVIFVYGILLRLIYVARKTMKKLNPNYSLLDDVLLWTGIPVVFGYFLFVFFNPKNQEISVADLIDSTQHIMLPLLVWMVFGTFYFLWRNRKSQKTP